MYTYLRTKKSLPGWGGVAGGRTDGRRKGEWKARRGEQSIDVLDVFAAGGALWAVRNLEAARREREVTVSGSQCSGGLPLRRRY